MLVVNIINMLKKYQLLKKRFKKWTTLGYYSMVVFMEFDFFNSEVHYKKISIVHTKYEKKNHKLIYNLVYISY